ncbi:hypothetical protein ACRXCV_10065 [Halobacteriovorax sp. GFR7]|uniref:hypothetical protein n=1 Tax=unclassified Halobacteriovorax TaxID=2639665 RepID=UPI003724588C
MKKLMAMAVLGLTLVSCGSSPQRDIASVDGACSLQKHPAKNHYRILINEKPHSQYWYTKGDALKIQDSFSKKGMCGN